MTPRHAHELPGFTSEDKCPECTMDSVREHAYEEKIAKLEAAVVALRERLECLEYDQWGIPETYPTQESVKEVLAATAGLVPEPEQPK